MLKKWGFEPGIRNIILILACTIINLLGRWFAERLFLPIWLDSVGTFLSAVLLGPVAGAISGALMNIVTSFWEPGQIWFTLVSIAGGLAVGRFFPRDRKIESFSVIATALFAGFVMTVVSTPLNLIFNQGYTGNAWGDALVDMLSNYVNFKAVCCVAGELLVNMPDKAVSILIALLIVYIVRKQKDRGESKPKNGTSGADTAGVSNVDVSTILTGAEDDSKSNVSMTNASITSKSTTGMGTTGTGIVILAAITAATLIPLKFPTEIYAYDNVATPDFNSDYAAVLYGMDDGLVSSEINTIEQTADGYIWAGAYSGLYRYDGSKFEKIDLDDRINNAIYLYEDDHGRLWIGTNDNGIACYDISDGGLVFYTTEDGLPSDSIRSICEDDEGNIYVSTTAELCRIEGSLKNPAAKGKVYVYSKLPEITCVYSLCYLGDGRITGVTQNGLLFVMKDGELLYSGENEDSYEAYTAVGCGEDGNLLVGTSGISLKRFRLQQDGSLAFLDTTEVPEINYVNCIRYDNIRQGFCIACWTGLAYADLEGNVTLLSRDDFNSSVNDAIIDYQDNIWFASTKQGILKLSYDPFSNISKKAGIDEAAVNALLIDDGRLYVGTDSGLTVIDISTYKTVNDSALDETFKDVRIRHLMRDRTGNIWVSTYGQDGLVCIKKDGSVITSEKDMPGALGSRYRFTLELSDGTILAFSTDGINYINNYEVIRTVSAEDGLNVPQILCAVETEDGTVLAGSDGDGIYRIKDGVITGHIGAEEGLESLVILRIAPGKGGYFYVTSNGLYYDGRRAEVRMLKNFPYNNNYDVYITGEGEAWVSSSAGIFVVRESDLIDDGEYNCILLNHTRGFDTTLTANAWNTVSGNSLYLCCTDGVRRINTSTYDDLNDNYEIVIASMTDDDENVPVENGVYMIPSGSGRIQIEPAVLNYAISNPLISMHLEGAEDTGMVMHQNEMTGLYYTTLPYGDYELHIEVLDELDGAVKKEQRFMLHKEAELYEHLYYKLYLIFVGGMLVAFLAWMIAKMSNMAVINRQYDQIREAKEEAEYANQAKSRFLANMSHEIRTPINAVLGMDEMILRESNEPDIRGYASDIYTAGNTLLSLINDILDSSKIESGKMEIVPVEYELATLIHDLVNMISQRAQAKDLRLEVEVDGKLPSRLFGDDVRIRQVVTNILTNAVKYTLSGTVWIRVSDKTGDTAAPNNAGSDSSSGGNIDQDREALIHFEVEDTGIGIKEEDLPKLFEAYQRIEEGRNRNIEGTGLGMNITLQLLHMMGSRLEVESVYGKGSKFYFDIRQKIVDDSPIGDFESSMRSANEKYHHEGAFTAPDARVLVVDDNAMNRKVFRSLLKITQIQVSEAGGGAEALELAENEAYDIVFMDHMMPDMDGVETMKRMRKISGYDKIPIYVLTANAVTGAKEQYLEAGFDGFISKPIVSEKLEQAIRETLPDEMLKPLDESSLHNSSSAGAGPALPEDMPGIDGVDWNYAWLHLPDMELLESTVGEFYDVLVLQADKLDKMWDEVRSGLTGDGGLDEALEAYRIQVHGMKSAAATIGIVPLAGMAKMLEFAARDGDTDTMVSMHGVFISEWRSYGDKLKGVFGLGEDDAEAGNKETADSDMLRAMMDMLGQAMEDFDVDAADDIIEKMKSYKYEPEIEELIKSLTAAVKDLDQDEAESIMGRIKEQMSGE
ncbi:MAG: response regulator [Lachnospiraceae bacterium]|nr:response regulator [Lachnospiraceae bacterium]